MQRDDQWVRIEERLPGKATDRGVTAKDNRRFVEAVVWILRTGSPWRDLPEELGHWHRTFVRFSRWREKGVWERLATAMRGDADMEHLCCSTRPSFVPTSIPSAPKKSQESGNRPIAGKADHQVACRSGCLRQSAVGDSLRRPDRRPRINPPNSSWPTRATTRMLFYRVHYSTKQSGYHSASLQSAALSLNSLHDDY